MRQIDGKGRETIAQRGCDACKTVKVLLSNQIDGNDGQDAENERQAADGDLRDAEDFYPKMQQQLPKRGVVALTEHPDEVGDALQRHVKREALVVAQVGLAHKPNPQHRGQGEQHEAFDAHLASAGR